MKGDKRTSAQAESLQTKTKKTQKQQGVYLTTFASTSQNISFKSGSEESGPSGSKSVELRPVRIPITSYNLLKTPRYAMELISGTTGKSC